MSHFLTFKNWKILGGMLILLQTQCGLPIVQHQNISKQYATKIELITPTSIGALTDCERMEFETKSRETADFTCFDGIPDTDGQVDVQVAVGGGYVMHATNDGISVFDKSGNLLHATRQSCLQDGIDPKLFFDIHNQFFAIDFYHYYDQPKKKPVNISVSASSDPTKGWHTYAVSLPTAEDGGGLGYSKKWLAYTYPEVEKGSTILLSSADAKSGKPTKVYHFDNDFGQPAFGQDALDDIYFLQVNDTIFTLHKITTDADNVPYVAKIWEKTHGLEYVASPPPSPQKGTATTVSSGDRNPKNLVIQGGYLWFAHTINYEGRAAVQWHQIRLTDGETMQTGVIEKENSNYIQATIAVNKNLDVLVGFQETNADMYVSPSFVYRKNTDPNGEMREVITVEKGTDNYGDGSEKNVPWGDYSGSILDGDNLTDLWTVQNIMKSKKAVGNRIVKLKMKN